MRRPFPTARPSGAPGTARENLAAWLILGSTGAFLASAGLVSLAGSVASLLAGRGWRWSTGWELPIRLVQGDTQTAWPGVPPWLVWCVAAALLMLLLAVAITLGLTVADWRAGDPDPARHLASPADVAALCPQAAHERAMRLRPSLRSQLRHPPSEDGMLLGHLRPRGPALRSSWEDCAVFLMPPRAGKTTAAAVGAIIEAPGPALVTSNKSDVLTTTIGIRRHAGTCWVFDPQGIAFTPQAMWWDPLRRIRDVSDARRLAGHFLQEVMATANDRDFWNSAAMGLLSALIMAAACSRGTMRDVWSWLNDSADRTPIERLHAAGQTEVAKGLHGRQGGAWETREGIYETARTAAQCLESEHIMAWITPPRRPIPELDLAGLAGSRDTLYLLSKEDTGAAQPLVAALADETLRVAERLGEASGGRLDPPLLPVLDEAANICKIRDLPRRYSHCGSRGIPVVTILQNFDQGKGVWGDVGMGTLWAAATIKVIGGGIDDARLVEDLSKLIGEHDVTIATRSRDARGGWSESTSVRRQRILPPEDLRALPAWQGVLLATRCRAALIRLRPWFESEHAAQIAAASASSHAELTERAARGEI